MAYLIDGHNLIPHVPGLSLSDPDDERRLVELLQALYPRLRRRLEVYFDRAPAGMQGTRKAGTITVHFVRQGLTADEAIRLRLRRLGGDSHNWTVVSSDHQVQTEARAAHAKVLSSEQFARLLAGAGTTMADGKPSVSQEDVQRWLEEFSRLRDPKPPDL